jgi:hypothetical protein
VQLGYYRDLPMGFSVSAQPSYAVINYDADFGVFGAARRDRLCTLQTSLLNRRIDLYGFTPRAAYTFARNDSSISLFAYHRNRFEIGVTRQF